MQSKIGVYEGYSVQFTNKDSGLSYRYRVIRIEPKQNNTCVVDLEFESVSPYGKVINSCVVSMGQHNALPLGMMKVAVRHLHSVNNPVTFGKKSNLVVLHFMHPMNVHICEDKKIFRANLRGEILHRCNFGERDVFNTPTKSDTNFKQKNSVTEPEVSTTTE